MECPRCSGALTVYRLGESTSWVCRVCGHVGVETEHGSEPERSESWERALQRFYQRHVEPRESDEGAKTDGDEIATDGTDERDADSDEPEAVTVESNADTDEPGPDTDDLTVEAIATLEGLDLPGSAETRQRRREAVAELYAYLRERGTGTRQDFLELVDPDAVDYASPEGFWKNAGREGLRQLPGVRPPASGHHEWEFDGAKTEG